MHGNVHYFCGLQSKSLKIIRGKKSDSVVSKYYLFPGETLKVGLLEKV